MEKQAKQQTKQQTDKEFDRRVDMEYMHAILLQRLAQGGDRDAIITQFYADFSEEFQFTVEERAYLESNETYGIDIK